MTTAPAFGFLATPPRAARTASDGRHPDRRADDAAAGLPSRDRLTPSERPRTLAMADDAAPINAAAETAEARPAAAGPTPSPDSAISSPRSVRSSFRPRRWRSSSPIRTTSTPRRCSRSAWPSRRRSISSSAPMRVRDRRRSGHAAAQPAAGARGGGRRPPRLLGGELSRLPRPRICLGADRAADPLHLSDLRGDLRRALLPPEDHATGADRGRHLLCRARRDLRREHGDRRSRRASSAAASCSSAPSPSPSTSSSPRT